MKPKDLKSRPTKAPFGVAKSLKSPSYKKMFRDARRTLDEREGRGPREPMINWNESKVEYVKRIRHEAREALLNVHVPERRCGKCGELKPRSRQWVVLRGKELKVFGSLSCVCRGCYRRHYVNLSKDVNVGGRPRK